MFGKSNVKTIHCVLGADYDCLDLTHCGSLQMQEHANPLIYIQRHLYVTSIVGQLIIIILQLINV